MGRFRTLNPELAADPVVATLPDDVWRLFVSLYMLADDEGRLAGDPAYLSGNLFWGVPRSLESIEAGVAILDSKALIQRYVVAGAKYIAIVGWRERDSRTYQVINKPSSSRIPKPDEKPDEKSLAPEELRPTTVVLQEPSCTPPVALMEDSGTTTVRKGKEGKGRERRSMSGKPDDGPLDPLAVACTEEVNKHAGTNYLPTSKQLLEDCKKLGRKGITPAQVRDVIRSKTEWLSNERMHKRFVPSTLMRPSNFERYLEDLAAGTPQLRPDAPRREGWDKPREIPRL